MDIEITAITCDDIASFRECLDRVARERRFLALLEAPSLEHMNEFVSNGIRDGVPRVIAKAQEQVVGWCDIQPRWHHTLQHCGSLGMGLLPEFRGCRLGQRLLESCIAIAREAGITRVELETRSDNERALRLYRRAGFEHEGIRRHGMRVDGEYLDTIAMALLL